MIYMYVCFVMTELECFVDAARAQLVAHSKGRIKHWQPKDWSKRDTWRPAAEGLEQA